MEIVSISSISPNVAIVITMTVKSVLGISIWKEYLKSNNNDKIASNI